MARTVGIDLGTTNSVVAFIEGERVEPIPNSEGSRLTPSVVYYKGESEIIVGELAKRQLVIEPARVIRSIKRIIGKRFEELGEEAEDLPYTVVELEDGMAGVKLGENMFLRPEEVAADVLDKLRMTAEDFIGDEVAEAVITVPAHFNDQQRTATKAAAEMAGLEVQRIINEPTAAALAYGVGTSRSGCVAVFDFGGGTFDISILQISRDIFEVLSTNGDNHLGGDDVDHVLYQEICDGILQETGIDPTMEPTAVQRIREAAEKAKCELSSLSETTVSLPFIVADSGGPKHYETTIDRVRFNELCDTIFQRLFEPCRRALEDADLGIEDIDEVLLVGGSTRIPRVQEMVAEYFAREPNHTVNPDEAVAVGAAIQSGVITGALREVLLLDVTPLTLGIELAGGVFKELITRNSTIPCEASRRFTTVVDNQTSVVVHVLQGERKRADENHSLAKFRLVGIPPAPKELAEIEVTFRIDADGILSVTAMDTTTGIQTGVVVENYGEIGSRRELVDRIVKSAEDHLDEDEEFVRFAEKRQKGERIQDRANKTIEALGDIITQEDLKTLKESMLRIDLAIAKRDANKLDDLEETINDILTHYEENEDLARMLSRNLSQSEIEMQHGVLENVDIHGNLHDMHDMDQSGLPPQAPQFTEGQDEQWDGGETFGQESEAPFAPPLPPPADQIEADSHAPAGAAQDSPAHQQARVQHAPASPQKPAKPQFVPPEEEPGEKPGSEDTSEWTHDARFEVPVIDEDDFIDDDGFDPGAPPPPPPT